MTDKLTGLKRIELFSKYKGDHTIFVETGTHLGDSVQVALDLGFTKVISIELIELYYKQCEKRFAEEIEKGTVVLFKGDSAELMTEMLALVDTPALFWLDGHGDNVPLDGELKAIKEHTVKNHTILIDDIPKYPKYFTKETVEGQLKDINPDYKFTYENALNESNMTDVYEDYDLAAYIN